MRRFRIRNIIPALALLAGSMIFAFGIIEISFRLFAPQIIEVHPNGMWQLSPTRGCRLIPDFDSDHPYWDFRVRITTSHQGLRDRAYGPKASGTYRILTLGDSFTFGFGVEGHEAYPKQLETLLQTVRNPTHYEVINAGFPGYGTHQELLYLKEEGLQFQPDLILIGFFGGNDLQDNLLELNRFTIVNGNLYNKEGYERVLQARRNLPGGLPIPFKDVLWAHIHTYRFLADRYHRLLAQLNHKETTASDFSSQTAVPIQKQEGSPRPIATVDREILEITEGFLQDIVTIARTNKADVALILIPDIKQINNAKEMWLPTWNALKSFAHNHELPVIDLVPAFWKAHQEPGR